ncbi:hypothetical protein SCHPADRAFT_839474, partial [Schizopora paradoxa]
EEGFNRFMAALEQKDAEAAKWWKEYYMNKYASFTDGCLDGPEAKQGGWRLQVIGVLPEYQRYGIGAALIKVIEDKVNAIMNKALVGLLLITKARYSMTSNLHPQSVQRSAWKPKANAP